MPSSFPPRVRPSACRIVRTCIVQTCKGEHAEPVHAGEASIVGDEGLAVVDERGRQMQGVHRPQPEVHPQVDGTQDHPTVDRRQMDARGAAEQFKITLDQILPTVLHGAGQEFGEEQFAFRITHYALPDCQSLDRWCRPPFRPAFDMRHRPASRHARRARPCIDMDQAIRPSHTPAPRTSRPEHESMSEPAHTNMTTEKRLCAVPFRA